MSSAEKILDSVFEGIFTVNKEFRINFFNKPAEMITGYRRQDVIGKFCKNVFKSDFCENHCPIVNAIEADKSVVDFNTRICCKNGQKKSVRLNASVIKNENMSVGGIISFREIQDLINIENQLVRNTHFYGIVGFNKQMTDIFNLIFEIAECDATVLICGETGTGKELIANAIQSVSRRKDKPFVKINCSVIPPNLLASELFGHVKGAFTDAIKDRCGRFELAHKGTIFLDEVAEMSTQMQLQILRVIQEGTFERIGESTTRKVDTRIIAATNVNIEDAIKHGRLREDLYYRLNVIPIIVPPLRERKEDIPFLISHFLKKFSLLYKKDINKIDETALKTCIEYLWPGNVRELENAIEFAFIRTSSKQPLTLEKLPLKIKESQINSSADRKIYTMRTAELVQLLENNLWNKSKVAQILGIHRTTVWRRIKELGIEK